MYLVAFLRLFSVRSMKSVVSSANVSARDSSVAYVMPVMFFVVVILMSRISTMMINKYGEMMSPWGTPCSRWIRSDRCPPVRICASLSRKKVLIQVIMSWPKPRALSVVFMKS